MSDSDTEQQGAEGSGFSREALEKRSVLMEKELAMWKAAYDTLAKRLEEVEEAEQELIYERARQGKEESDATARELEMYRYNYPRYVERLNVCESWRAVIEPEFERLRAQHAKCVDSAGEVAGLRERVKAMEIEQLRVPVLVKTGRQELAKELTAAFQEEKRTLLRRAEADRDRMREEHQHTKDELTSVREEAELSRLRVQALERAVENEKRTVRKLDRTVKGQEAELASLRSSAKEAAEARETILVLRGDAEVNKKSMAANAQRYDKVVQMYRDAMEREATLKREMDSLKIAFSDTEIGRENAKLREIATDVTHRLQKAATHNVALKARVKELEMQLQMAAVQRAADRGKVAKRE